MKKKTMLGIISFMMILAVAIGILKLLPMVEQENIAYENISIKNFFQKDGHFYVYFYRDDCRYCLNVDEDIDKFAETNIVYKVDAELCKGVQNYDWDNHEEQYDIEIGRKDDAGEIIFYDNLSEKDIKEKYDPLNYKIVCANERYAELHVGKEVGKIYAVLTHPKLRDDDLKAENFVIPAIPMMVEFENHQVKNYYFDDKEIIAYLKSETKPLDLYWNLE